MRASAHQTQALDLDQGLRPHLLVVSLKSQARLLFDPPLAPVARQAPAEDDEPMAQAAHGLGVSSNFPAPCVAKRAAVGEENGRPP